MKLFRIAFSVLGLLLVIAVVAVGSLVYFIDPNKLRPVIVEEVMAKTGYQLAIYGKLSWSWYPNLGVRVERMTLIAPDQNEPFIDLHNMVIGTELTQLLHGPKELQGDIRIADVKLMNVHVQNAHVGLHWQNKVLTLEPMQAFLYGGELRGIAHGMNLSTMPSWNWDVKLSGVQVDPLLVDANGAGQKIKLTGVGEVAIQASTSGISREQLLSHLNGTSAFRIANGSVEGVDINYLIQAADAILNKKTIAPPADITHTTFDSLNGTAAIHNGVVDTNNFLLLSSTFKTKAQGTINLQYQAINFALQIAPLTTKETPWDIPVLVTGNLHNPDIRLDTLEIQNQLAKRELNKVKERVQNELKNVSGKAGELLQNLLHS